MFLALQQAGIFRVTQKDQMAGLDNIKHKERAYSFGMEHLFCTKKMIPRVNKFHGTSEAEIFFLDPKYKRDNDDDNGPGRMERDIERGIIITPPTPIPIMINGTKRITQVMPVTMQTEK